MKALNVRFGDSQKIKLDDAAEVLNMDFSKVARAAMRLGLQQILTLSAVDLKKANDLVLINDAMAK